jgi:hypothetical protein
MESVRALYRSEHLFVFRLRRVPNGINRFLVMRPTLLFSEFYSPLGDPSGHPFFGDSDVCKRHRV